MPPTSSPPTPTHTHTPQQQNTLHLQQHVNYIVSLDKLQKDTLEYQVTEHLRLSAIYWALCGLHLLELPKETPAQNDSSTTLYETSLGTTQELMKFVNSCWDEKNGAFGGNKYHDAHLLYTLSAIQIMALCGVLQEELPKSSERYQRVVQFVVNCQQEDGSWIGDQYGEVDTRFVYCGFNCLKLLGALDRVNVEKSVEWIFRCQNFDGGFGVSPGAESHSGQIFCCVAALDIVDAIPKMGQDNIDQLAWWLSERQCENGGLNGRPEKLADVCYSWWVLSALTVMQRLDWIDRDALSQFILNCQDPEKGGISDKPDNMVDVFHTFFGIAGLSLMDSDDRLNKIDPTFALPIDTLKRLGIKTNYTNRFESKE